MATDSAFPKRIELTIDLPDPRDGPDYVDDWMEKNLAPSIIDFIRSFCTSFARWDLLRQLHADSAPMTAGYLARAIGTNHVAACAELERLSSSGLVNRRRRGGRTTYQVELESDLGRVLDAAIREYDGNREFRFALVYSIVRASHRGAVLD